MSRQKQWEDFRGDKAKDREVKEDECQVTPVSRMDKGADVGIFDVVVASHQTERNRKL